MPFKKKSLLTSALTKLAVELGADLAKDKTLDKIKDGLVAGSSKDRSRKYSNVGRKERRHADDSDDEDSEEEYERRERERDRRKRRDSVNRKDSGRFSDYEDEDRSYRRPPPPLMTAPGNNVPPSLPPGTAGAYAYDEFGNPYPLPVNPPRRSTADDQPRSSSLKNGNHAADALPRHRRGSSTHEGRPHVAFADEVDERDREYRPVPARQNQQNSQVTSPTEIRAPVLPPTLPVAVSAMSSASNSRSSSMSSSTQLASSPLVDAQATASMGGAGISIRDIVFAARCSNLVYRLTDSPQANAYLKKAEDDASLPTVLDVCFDNESDRIRNFALFRRKSDGVFCLAVRGSGKKGSEWATDMFRNVASGNSSLEAVTPLLLQDGSVLYAHAGLLQYTLAMMRTVMAYLWKRAKGSPKRLIITGHSSGGAIASLIYILLEHNYQSILDRFRTIHCISFGSPPCVRTQDLITSRSSDGLFGIVMKGDPIPRMDLAYAADILEKYPLQVSSLYSSPHRSTTGQDTVEATLLAIATAVAGKNVEAPKQTIVPAGKLVLIDPGVTDVWDMSKEYLEESAFYNIAVHNMTLHLQSLERLRDAYPDIVLD
ncbi:hypothetical protein OC846_001143 [Tilletia horrida]|uniref:Fungal lipase-type domain-containing protein n=1 Tax=Tilletia horrida TaxID=155126 RepID=A0AAN6GUG8_9BASI|nr:hypothetical protein OC846_001143 [Tilletia horrida]KAK0569376.1 hypothetical protein OC861_000982 [Tilletia horrida]